MKKRGQAFETMMLVISVIVAIAILGILLGFLTNVTIIGADAKQVIADKVESVYTAGYGVETTDRVDFKKDLFIMDKDLTKNRFNSDQLHLSCVDGDLVCGEDEDSAIQIDTDRKTITVNKGTKAYVAVCTDEGYDYYIAIGSKTADARNQCLEEME